MCEDKGSAQGTPFVFTIIRELFLRGKYHRGILESFSIPDIFCSEFPAFAATMSY